MKVEVIKNAFKASTWCELKTKGKFDKNVFISDDMLIVESDIGSETYYARAIDTRGSKFSMTAFLFNNNAEGFRVQGIGQL